MKRVVILIVAFLLAADVLGQAHYVAPYRGYMGRRVLFNMEMSMAPSFSKVPNFRANSKYWAFNYLLQPNVEVIAWRRGTVGAKFIWFDTKFNSYDDWSYETVTRDLRVLGGGIFCKVYLGKGSTAPLGPFLRFNFDYMRGSYEIPQPDGFVSQEVRNCYGFRFDFGRDFLFCDFLRLTFGMSVGLSFPGLYFLKFSDELEIQQRAANRIFRNYFFGVNVGIGFLTF